MPWTRRKELAYEALDKAVEELRAAFNETDDPDDESVLVGWVLLTSAVEFIGDAAGDEDPLDTRSVAGWYSKRGQHPVLGYGIVQEGLRHYNETSVQSRGDDD